MPDVILGIARGGLIPACRDRLHPGLQADDLAVRRTAHPLQLTDPDRHTRPRGDTVKTVATNKTTQKPRGKDVVK